MESVVIADSNFRDMDEAPRTGSHGSHVRGKRELVEQSAFIDHLTVFRLSTTSFANSRLRRLLQISILGQILWRAGKVGVLI